MKNFLIMGHYGLYIWTAFGMTAFVLILNIILPVRKKKQLLKK
jgi:heme exporter protein D